MRQIANLSTQYQVMNWDRVIWGYGVKIPLISGYRRFWNGIYNYNLIDTIDYEEDI